MNTTTEVLARVVADRLADAGARRRARRGAPAASPGSRSRCTSRTSPGPATSGRCERPCTSSLPDGIDDPARPSGGNIYDRRVCDGLARRRLDGARAPGAGALAAARRRRPARRWPASLAALPDERVVLVDGLIASAAPDVLVPGGRAAAARRPGAHAARRRSTARRGRRARGAGRGRGRRHHQRLDPALAARALRRCDPARVHVAEPGVDAAPSRRAPPAGGELLCVAAVTPGKGHDLLLAALAGLATCPGAASASAASTATPASSSALRRPGRRAAASRDRVDFVGPADRRTRWPRRTPPPTCSCCRPARPTAWSSPRRWPAGCRWSRRTSAACPRPWAGCPTGAGPGCWCRPTTRRARPARCGAGCDDRRLRERLRAGRPHERRASLTGWADDHRAGRPGCWRRSRREPPCGGRGRGSSAALAVLGVLVWRLGTGRSSTACRAVDARPSVAGGRASPCRPRSAAPGGGRLVARGLGRRPPAAAGRRRVLPLAVPQHRRCPAACSATCTGASGTAATSATPAAGCGPSAWERVAGQVVQVVLALVVLLLLPSPSARRCRPSWWRARRGRGRRSPGRAARRRLGGAPVVRALRAATCATVCCARAAWPGVAVASAVAVAGHVAHLPGRGAHRGRRRAAGPAAAAGAARAAGMAVPANIAGWGPREGVAAWAFGAAGLGAAAGRHHRRGVRRDGARRQPARRRRPARRSLRSAPAHAAGSHAGDRVGRRCAMAERPYTLLSCGMSLDGYLDSAVRGAAAALQRRRLRPGRRGAGRLRRDPGRRGDRPQRQPAAARARPQRDARTRVARGLPATPVKVTVTERADLDAGAQLLRRRRREKLVYCASARRSSARVPGSDGSRRSSTAAEPVDVRRD